MSKHIVSKDNPWFKKLKQLSLDNTAYRIQQSVWIEGEHLCQSAIQRGWRFDQLVLADHVSADAVAQWQDGCDEVVLIPQAMMDVLSSLPSPSWIGGVVRLPDRGLLSPGVGTVVLDGVQDPGNAGAILRSAAAFGFSQVVSTKASVALWSAKVVRAGMGAHFGLSIHESVDIIVLMDLGLPIYVTSSHDGHWLHDLTRSRSLQMPCVWVLGHEGRGVSDQWLTTHVQSVRIAQPGGEESLNVASAAAICMHASATQLLMSN
jgi:TrmH family RNA methyltransferase